jgi:colanic acid biosynthesis glycosyl transferase WcaI
MKILIVAINHAPEPTGIGKYVGEMAEWVEKRGAEVRVVTAPPYYPEWRVARGHSGWRYRRERRGRSTVIRCPLYVPRRPSGLKRIVHLASFALSSAPAIAWQAIAWRPDLVIAIEPPLLCSPAALVAARLCGARTWLHVQDFEVDAAFDLGLVDGRGARTLHRFASAVEKLLMRSFDRVSTISAAMDQRLADKGVPAPKRFVFPNWVDTESMRPHALPSSYRAELGIPHDTRVVLYSGNLGRKQGVDVLLDAARLLESDAGLAFVICGDGAERERLHALGAGLRNVRFLPLQPVERLSDLLNLADVHALPQRAAAEDLVMPSKLAAMMATGRPVVATANAGSEVARAVEGNGCVVPPGDAAALAAALAALCADDSRRASLGAAAREYARAHWDKAAVLGSAFGPCSPAAL